MLDPRTLFFRQKRQSRTWNRHFCAKNADLGLEIAVFGPKTPFLAGKIALQVRKP